jgi:hypothetical protein
LDIDENDVWSYEFAPVPTSFFTNDEMRICKAKSSLKSFLQIEVSQGKAGVVYVTVIDGLALL